MPKSNVTPWTEACQAPLSMELSRPEYWSGLSFPSAGYLPDQGIEPASSALQAAFFTSEPLGKALNSIQLIDGAVHAWKIPWTKEPGGLQSMGSQRAGHN